MDNVPSVPDLPKLCPEKTPLPTDAESVFNHGVIDASSGAAGAGQQAFGISDTGVYYQYRGSQNTLHFAGTVKANRVPSNTRKQLQNQLKERLKAKENQI